MSKSSRSAGCGHHIGLIAEPLRAASENALAGRRSGARLVMIVSGSTGYEARIDTASAATSRMVTRLRSVPPGAFAIAPPSLTLLGVERDWTTVHALASPRGCGLDRLIVTECTFLASNEFYTETVGIDQGGGGAALVRPDCRRHRARHALHAERTEPLVQRLQFIDKKGDMGIPDVAVRHVVEGLRNAADIPAVGVVDVSIGDAQAPRSEDPPVGNEKLGDIRGPAGPIGTRPGSRVCPGST